MAARRAAFQQVSSGAKQQVISASMAAVVDHSGRWSRNFGVTASRRYRVETTAYAWGATAPPCVRPRVRDEGVHSLLTVHSQFSLPVMVHCRFAVTLVPKSLMIHFHNSLTIHFRSSLTIHFAGWSAEIHPYSQVKNLSLEQSHLTPVCQGLVSGLAA